MKGIDHASTVDYGVAKKDGAEFVFRYSAGAGNGNADTQFKLCKPNEIAMIEADGLIFCANSEWYETRCTEGAGSGAQDGAADLAFWKSRGLQRGKSIYVSWDSAPRSDQYASVAAYMAAYNTALQGYYVADGMYAGIPALVWLSNNAGIRHGWIPEGASWSLPNNVQLPPNFAPPAVTEWDLWSPTPSQVSPAVSYLTGKLAGHKLVSCVWQDRNKWFNGAADENVLMFGQLGSVAPTPPIIVDPPVPKKLYQGAPVPALIAKGTGQYLGNINGPAESHGGYNASEQPIVKMLQQRLIVCGFVLGHTNPNDGWADGVFDVQGAGMGGPTTDAVTRFQRAHMPHTQFYGQVWWDDWTTLFNL